MELTKIAFGGGCHWCTEAVFQTLIGVHKVEQGFISSTAKNNTFSEAVIVHFNTKKIELKILIEIHLLTHKSTSNHSMRSKYRSAVYYFSNSQKEKSLKIIDDLQMGFKDKIITQIVEFTAFKPSIEEFQNYYQSNPSKPFCETYINPKLKFLVQNFSNQIEKSKVSHLIPAIKEKYQFWTSQKISKIISILKQKVILPQMNPKGFDQIARENKNGSWMEAEFYKLNKGNKLNGNDQTYTNFIHKIVETTIEGITIKEDSYDCETSKLNYKK